MSRSLKKITHKYEFLKLELEEVKEELEEYLSVWTKHFGKYFAQKKSEMWVNEETGEMRETPPVDDEEEEIKKPKKKQKPQKLKKLYKKLSTYTHPDKGGDVEDFNAIKKSYEEEDFLELLKFAGLYQIDFELEEEDELLVEQSCTNIQKEIQTHKGSMAYAFGSGDIQKKLAVIQMLEQHLGIEIKKEDYPKELLDLL